MTPVYRRVEIDQLRANSWNPNAMDPEMYAKAKVSIEQFGFVDPVTVRQQGHEYEIIDGENRWRAAKDLHHTLIDVADLGLVEDAVAQQLTIVLNELRGEYDPSRMGRLLTGLVAMAPLPDLLKVLPFTRQKFDELTELPKVDWNQIEPVKPPRTATRDQKWAERVYRMPEEAAQTLDAAIESNREPGEPDWQVLVRLVGDE